MKKKLLIATGNSGKLAEFAELLAELAERLLQPADLGLTLDVAETGSTYQENATLKALAFAQASGLLSLADDSGLEVDALGGAPGVYSARYAPQPRATDADRCSYLLENLRGQPQPWGARFQCVITVATPQGELIYGRGTCEGQIIPVARGRGGFGYDPIFQLANGRTMAELDPQEKNRLSHRALAVLDVREKLLALLT